MNDESLVDAAVYRELQDAAGADFAAELVGTFLEEAPAMLAVLHSSHAAGAADPFRRAAHSLKSNSQTFGAMKLAEAARALELGGLAAADAQALGQLQALYSRSAQALQALAHD